MTILKPQILSATFTPNPAETSETILLRVQVQDVETELTPYYLYSGMVLAIAGEVFSRG